LRTLTDKQRLKQQIRMLQLAEKTWNNSDYEDAGRKAAKMSNDSLLGYVDASLLELGKATYDYRRTPDLETRQDIVRELVRSCSVYQAIVEELLFRNGLEF
jgi:hypothetical protein